MKILSLLFISLLFVFCKNEIRRNEICISKIIYKPETTSFEPSEVKLSFLDYENVIEKKIKQNSYGGFFFISINEDARKSFYSKKNYYEKKGDTIFLYAGTYYFEFDTKKKWTPKEVENYLMKGGVGLLIGKDTIQIKDCN